ncbi:class I SAM-dependent methyltransferase [Balneola sp. MJW-20]|uniref:class I SAM-dependent methyltransferase n=1 Tax=Gracilimonas aurantiaca TaxID=3234185 RepID=UPI003466B7EE
MNIFNELKIKIADQPFIFVPLSIFALLLILSAYFFSLKVFILTGFLLLFLLTSSTIWHTYRSVTEEHSNQLQSMQALLSIQNFINPRAPIPPMVGWAAHPVLISNILEVIHEHDVKTVLELGSGSSTIITSYYLESLEGDRKLISLDHDGNFLEQTRNQVRLHELENIATVHHTPLVKYNDFTWYDISDLELEKGSVDLLVVDGPPMKTQTKARKPALYVLKEYLSDNAVIIMDDANREDESEIAREWVKDFPGYTLKHKHSSKGVAILTPDRNQ